VDRAIRGSPAIGRDGTVYVGGDEGRLFALDPATGGTRWSVGTSGPLTGAPAVGADGMIYLGSNDGRLYVLTPAGQVAAQYQVDGPIDVSSPAIAGNGILYVGTRSGTLYALREGGPVAAPTPATPAVPTVAVPGDFAFVRCGSGRIYSVGADRVIGGYVTSPAAVGGAPIFQVSDTVPQAFVDAVCGPGR
jgi:hypothetical protein